MAAFGGLIGDRGGHDLNIVSVAQKIQVFPTRNEVIHRAAGA